MKEYFSHDYSARDDEKIKRLFYAHKWEGYGLYWGIIETLYQNGGYMLLDYESIAFDMRTHKELIDSIINGFDLFKFKENKFYSESVLRRLKERKNKSIKASESAKARWNKETKDDANALRTESDSNAIKEKNIKEYIYSEFYDSEIEKNKNSKEFVSYELFVKFLFGENPLKQKLSNWIKLSDQMTYEQYEPLVIKARSKNIKISDKLLSGFNEPKYLKGKKSVYLTLNNWISRDGKHS